MGTPAERKAELLEARATRAKARELADEAHELQVLELENEWSEKLGHRGIAFEIVNTDNAGQAGPIVLKRPDPAAVKLWQSKDGNAPEDAFALVKGCVVYPAADKLGEIYGACPLLITERAVSAVTWLAGRTKAAREGKF